MKPVIDLNREYGIVLEGGGARGAYQIGAWRALREAGVRISAVAGTSVGALNGAFICMDRLEQAEEIWKNISFSRIMDVDDAQMRKLFDGELPLKEAVTGILHRLGSGGVDVTPLKELLANYVDEDAIRNSPIPLYILTFNVDAFQELELNIKDVEPGMIKDYLLASAYIFPLFKNERINGKKYIDGGAISNVPLGTLIDRGYRDIIMVRIFGPGREKKVKLPDDANVLVVEPRVHLGNFVDFDPRKSVRNMKIGYYDAMRMLYGLKGKIYYIEENREECYYLNQLVNVPDTVKTAVMEAYHTGTETDRWIRRLTEIIAPAAALELKLPAGWNYRDLYLAILEAAAKIYRIPKYQIYTADELRNRIVSRAAQGDAGVLPAFVRLILKDDISG